MGPARLAEYLLRLYVAGNTPSSRRAKENLSRLRAMIKHDDVQVKVIDVLAEPQLAEEASILATPTLSCDHSVRSRRIVGDLSDTRKILEFLGIEATDGDV
jgi:circadian clock protein KaiB